MYLRLQCPHSAELSTIDDVHQLTSYTYLVLSQVQQNQLFGIKMNESSPLVPADETALTDLNRNNLRKQIKMISMLPKYILNFIE